MKRNLTSREEELEIIKCGTDPAYFIRNYIEIQHPTKGRLMFELYPFQETVLEHVEKYRFNIVLKSRQLGLSTVMSAYCLWLAVFGRDKNILLVADKFQGSKNMLAKIRIAYRSLPKWMLNRLDLQELEGESVQHLKFSNGSKIQALPTTLHTGRGEAASFVVVDEAAINDKLDEAWKSIYSTVTTGGNIIVFSTPLGKKGKFYELWSENAITVDEFNEIPKLNDPKVINKRKNAFVQLELPWNVHPEHNQEWFDAETVNMSEQQIAQELLCVGPETNIVTLDGCKKAKEIQPGDMVLTHLGRYKKVVGKRARTLKSNEELYEISVPGNRQTKFYMTGNHPVLSYKVQKLYREKTITESLIRTSKEEEPKFIELSDLVKFENTSTKSVHAVLHPKLTLINNSKEEAIDVTKLHDSNFISETHCSYWRQRSEPTKRFINLDYNLGYWLGLCVAEGCVIENKSAAGIATETLQVAFRTSTELNTLGKWIQDFYESYNIQSTIRVRNYCDCFTISTCNKYFVELYKHFVVDGDATTKHLKLEKFLDNLEFTKGYIAGHYAGDGDHCVTKHNNGNKIKLVSSSEKLLYQMRTLLSHWGLYPRIGYWHEKPYYLEIDGLKGRFNSIEEVLDNANTLRINGSRTKLIKNNIVARFQTQLVPITTIPCVYDIEVEEDHSFIAQGLVVHNCSFESSGRGFFANSTQEWLHATSRLPMEYASTHVKGGNHQEIWVWAKPKPNHEYLLCADVARGDADDYSAFYILDKNDSEVVVEYVGKILPDKYADVLTRWGYQYNTAQIIQEKNTIGVATSIRLRDLAYPNLYYDNLSPEELECLTPEQKENLLPGFTTKTGTKSGNRDELLNLLENALRNHRIKIYSSRLAQQAMTFNVFGKSGRAPKGKNDDLIMALALLNYFGKPNATGDDFNSYNSQQETTEWAMVFIKGVSRGSRGQPNILNGKQLPPGVKKEDVENYLAFTNPFAWVMQ